MTLAYSPNAAESSPPSVGLLFFFLFFAPDLFDGTRNDDKVEVSLSTCFGSGCVVYGYCQSNCAALVE